MASTLALGSVTTLVAADWPSFRGPNHDGKSAETIAWPKDGPKQLWKINVGIGHSAVSVVGDRAYTMGNTDDIDTIFSIDIATGKIVWKHSYPCNEKVGITNYDGNQVADPTEMQEALRSSYAALKQVFPDLSDSDLTANVKMFGRETTKQGAALMLLMDQHEHLGQSIAYARSNSVVPTWSK